MARSAAAPRYSVPSRRIFSAPMRSGRPFAATSSASSSSHDGRRSATKPSKFIAVFYEGRISVATPEGVTLEATLAGVGSRFVAGVIDQLLRWSLLAALVALLAVMEVNLSGGDGLSGAGTVAIIVGIFFVQFGYDVLFEVLASGRTPGKRWTGLRVVKKGGTPIGFLA